ncbi:hypothetical protein [Microbacterium sp. No. 7]|uniref:hypothetical protein n=1 Tax=Microbacterium sp. No. 7 TaxID=1714373 RepID=UPI0006D16EB3|nr:hypothetical protein [Microbacterium sp. No. 7]ALJ20503.1 hypothetical protein AOA12_11545 [Microbacterium sp. No. 7]
MRHRFLTAAIVAASAIVLGSCATGQGRPEPAATPLESLVPAPPSSEVVGTGMVMDVAGDAQLCQGMIMESYPPQCHGVPLHGWSWDGVDGSESSGDATWGMYAVQGAYDGTGLTVTRPPILLALYDPPALPDPTGGTPGASDEDALTRVADELGARLSGPLVGVTVMDGYVWLDVPWDDGTLQRAADDEFGDGVVIVRSGLRTVE